MCACKSSFHQDGLKEELDFEVPRFSPFFFTASSNKNSVQYLQIDFLKSKVQECNFRNC